MEWAEVIAPTHLKIEKLHNTHHVCGENQVMDKKKIPLQSNQRDCLVTRSEGHVARSTIAFCISFSFYYQLMAYIAYKLIHVFSILASLYFFHVARLYLFFRIINKKYHYASSLLALKKTTRNRVNLSLFVFGHKYTLIISGLVQICPSTMEIDQICTPFEVGGGGGQI